MEIKDLITRFSDTRDNQMKAVFSSLFILSNKLQAVFDKHIPEISLKQFMLLVMVRQARGPLSLTQLGELLGCSRQNVKKLAEALAAKEFVTIARSDEDARAFVVQMTAKAEAFFVTEFAAYETQLAHLFADYSDAEMAQLFSLLMRLYDGVGHLDEEASHGKG